MPDLIVARVVHVLAIVLWIGGVAMVTTLLLPAARDLKTPGERIAFFDRIERRFAMQARVTTLIAGASGFYLVFQLGAWSRFGQVQFWWMHAMVLVWALFTLMLFVMEPLFLHRWISDRAQHDPDATLSMISRVHWVLLGLSLLAVAGAVAGSHGFSYGG